MKTLHSIRPPWPTDIAVGMHTVTINGLQIQPDGSFLFTYQMADGNEYEMTVAAGTWTRQEDIDWITEKATRPEGWVSHWYGRDLMEGRGR